MTWDVIVIGAGLAGLTCAQALHQQGYQVLVVEKSRGLGGRLATRRVDSVPVDHGCRFLTPTTPPLEALIPELVQQGVVVPWQPQVYQLTAAGSLLPQPLTVPLFTAPAGMSAIAKHLAQDLVIQRQSRAIALKISSDGAWQVIAAAPDQQTPALARCVVLAIPAPQAVDLLGRTESCRPQTGHPETGQDWQHLLQTVRYAPCLSLMAGFEPGEAGGPGANGSGWIVWGHPGSAIAYAALDSAKPGRRGQVVVIQSSAAFADQYLDASDLTEAGDRLLEAAAPILGSQPRWRQIHRWRYSQVTQSLDHPSHGAAIPIQAALPLFCCGDWCWGSDAEAAIASGQKAAWQVHTRLQSFNDAIL